MKKLNLSLVAIATLALIGCGGGGGSTGKNNSTQPTTNSGSNTNSSGGNTATVVNAQEGNIKNRLAYTLFAQDLVSGAEKKQCHIMPNGHSYTIQWLAGNNNLTVSYREYSNKNCLGKYPDVRSDSAKYRFNIGKVINGGKALEIDLDFVSGDDLTNDMPGHILGYDIEKTYYTIAVSAGSSQNQNLVWGVAKPTNSNDGSSKSKRANDVSDYTTGKFYFAQ